MAQQGTQCKLLILIAAFVALNGVSVEAIVPLIMSPSEASHATLLRDLDHCKIPYTETNKIRSALNEISGSSEVCTAKAKAAIDKMKEVQKSLERKEIKLNVKEEELKKLFDGVLTKTEFKFWDLDRTIFNWAGLIGLYKKLPKLHNWKTVGNLMHNTYKTTQKDIMERIVTTNKPNCSPVVILIAEGNAGGIGIQLALKFLRADKPIRVTAIIFSRYKIDKGGEDDEEWKASLEELKMYAGDLLKLVDTRIPIQGEKKPTDLDALKLQFSEEVEKVNVALGNIDFGNICAIFEAIVPAGFETTDNTDFLLRIDMTTTIISWMKKSKAANPSIQLVAIEPRCHTTNEHGHHIVFRGATGSIVARELEHYNADVLLISGAPREYMLAYEKDETTGSIFYQLRNTKIFLVLQQNPDGTKAFNSTFMKEAIIASRGACPPAYDEFLNGIAAAEVAPGTEYVEITLPNPINFSKPFLAQNIDAKDRARDRALIPL